LTDPSINQVTEREWNTFTPDGRRLSVKRHDHGWTVACGSGGWSAPQRLLDAALVEAILWDDGFALHSMPFDYAAWARELADRIERGELPSDGEE
jgi:hypothetical protein